MNDPDIRDTGEAREAAPDDFPQQLAELLGHLEGRLPPDHPFARLAATLPGGGSMGDFGLLWLICLLIGVGGIMLIRYAIRNR